MVLTLIAVICVICLIGVWNAEFKIKSEILAFLVQIIVSLVLVIAAVVCLILGLGCLETEETEYLLSESKELIGTISVDTSYAFLDEEGNCYYLNGDRMYFVNELAAEESVHCIIYKGNYEKIYIEKYKIDYKMTWWSFNFINGVEYRLYIPENIISE